MIRTIPGLTLAQIAFWDVYPNSQVIPQTNNAPKQSEHPPQKFIKRFVRLFIGIEKLKKSLVFLQGTVES